MPIAILINKDGGQPKLFCPPHKALILFAYLPPYFLAFHPLNPHIPLRVAADSAA